MKKPRYQPVNKEDTRMTPFPDWAQLLLNNDLDQFSDFDIHFHSYEKACFPCDFPYQYIIRLETFSEDYQFILRKAGLWEGLSDENKQAGSKKGIFK